MNRGKVTDEMRKRWKEQLGFLYPYRAMHLSKKEFDFITNMVDRFIIKGFDLTFHQSTWLNDICNKYQ